MQPAPAAVPVPALSLIGQRVGWWLFSLAAAAVLLVWAGESAFGVLAAHDRIGYPMLAVSFIVAAWLSRRGDRQRLIAQRLATAVLSLYLLGSGWALLLLPIGEARDYGIATLMPWLIATQIFVFACWPPRPALSIGVAVALLMPLPLTWLDEPSTRMAATLLNATLAQLLTASVLFGIGRQLRRLPELTRGDGSRPAALTIDELLTRHQHQRHRAQEAADEVSQALASREADLQTMLAAFPGPVGWSTHDGRYEYVNEAFAALFALRPEQMVGRHMREMIGEERYRVTLERRDRIRVEGRPMHFEHRAIDMRTGLAVDLLVTHFALPPRQPGQAWRYCQIAIDIGERKRAELALVAARDEAERASRAKSEFLSRMSHELRTPLNAVLGFGQLLELDATLESRQRTHVQEIVKAGRHLLTLIDEVLDLARVESGRIDLDLEALALAPLVAECVALVAPLAEARGITIDDDTQSTLRLHADRLRVKQVLLNLLSNAIKYNRDGGRVELSAVLASAGVVRISVLDNGVGIAADVQQQLFEPFNRLGAHGGSVPGVGIGLVITQRLIHAMGGRIGLESPAGPEGGSRFWFELPAL